jgi:sugar phosphate isomerase/epimerase
MKKLFNILPVLILVFFWNFSFAEKSEKSGWKLAIQSYTFHKFSLKESIAKANQTGIKNVEAFYNQPLGDGLEGTLLTMDEATQKQLIAYAKSQKVKIVATGVVSNKKREDWEQIFKLSSSMGIEVITCEPKYEDLKYVDELANKYKIDVAIHNHPKPSDYWNPDLFLENVKGLSERIGGCADIGHWKRMGVDPVEGLKKYGNRLKVVHLKDIEAKQEGKDYQDDVVLGKGIIKIDTIFKELKNQKFNGLFAIEFEGDQQMLMANVEEYVQFFNKSVSDLFKNQQ